MLIQGLIAHRFYAPAQLHISWAIGNFALDGERTELEALPLYARARCDTQVVFRRVQPRLYP